MLRKLKLRLRALFRREEIEDELALHLEQITAELMSHGLSAPEARMAALRQFGNTAQLQEESRDVFSFGWAEDLARDLRHGWRSLRRNPSVAAAAVLSMGLAIGVNTVIFSLIREVLFSEVTARAAGELVTIRLGGSSHASLSTLRDLNTSGNFQNVAGFDVETTVNWRDGNAVQQTPVMLVSENYFDLLETRPAVGRAFTSAEARAELNPHLVLITHRLWSRKFDRDPGLVGRTMVLNGRPYTVLGVLPEGFRPPTFLNTLPDLYVPASPELNAALLKPQSHTLMLVARRKLGQTTSQAYAALRAFAGRTGEKSVRLQAIGSLDDPDMAPLLAFAGLLVVAAFVVLWIACVNIAGVLIARAAARRREIATRLAIGASRGRLVRQLLAEVLLLAMMGAVAGLVLHRYLISLLNQWSFPLPIPIVFQMEPDAKLLLYSMLLTAIATLRAGLVPAWQSTRPGLVSGLKMEEPQYGYRRFTFRNGLIVAQVATTMVLVSVAMLFARSLARVNSLDPGFDLKHTAWARVSLLSDRFAKDQVYPFAARLLETAGRVPGVQSAALSRVVPFNNFMRSGSQIHAGSAIQVEYYRNSVSAAYFETMGIRLIAGRPFTAADRKGSDSIVINHSLADRLFPDRPAVGERIWIGDKEGTGFQIVGVVADTKHVTMGEKLAYAVYEPIARTQPSRAEINVLVRAGGDAASVVAPLRDALSAMDATAAVEAGPLRSKLAMAYLPAQIGAVLVGSLGMLALILALIGIYGAMAFAVSRRTAEIGIRMALGATTWQVLRAVLGTSFSAMGTGMALGTVLAMVAAQPLAYFLAEGITPVDPLTFFGVSLLCILTGVLAAVIPARRALAIDPIGALRVE
jgi:predicted permease